MRLFASPLSGRVYACIKAREVKPGVFEPIGQQHDVTEDFKGLVSSMPKPAFPESGVSAWDLVDAIVAGDERSRLIAAELQAWRNFKDLASPFCRESLSSEVEKIAR